MTLIRRFDYDLPSYVDKMLGKDSSDLSYNKSQVGYNVPAVNILENNESFLLQIAAPGYSKEDFNIQITSNVLVFSAKKQENSESSEQVKYNQREFNYSSWERTFTLPKTVETEKIEAQYESGVLKVLIPKKEEAKVKPPRAIEIK